MVFFYFLFFYCGDSVMLTSITYIAEDLTVNFHGSDFDREVKYHIDSLLWVSEWICLFALLYVQMHERESGIGCIVMCVDASKRNNKRNILKIYVSIRDINDEIFKT